jgi:hypothetical protein
MTDMNDTSYVPTNNQNPVVETPLATADQFPQPTGNVVPPRVEGDEPVVTALVDEPVDHTEWDTEEGEAILQRIIEESDRVQVDGMAVFGLDLPEPTDEELRQVEQEYRQEYPTAEELTAPAPTPAPKGKKK